MHSRPFALLLILAVAAGILPGQAQEIPAMHWTERSDWVNVQTDVTPAATGDGVTDDTAALQAAIDTLSSSYSAAKTMYLPPGTYRITDTLEATDLTGVSIIGSGANTTIVWDGASGGTMFLSDGITRGRFIGLKWDGSDGAAIGIDHASTTRYESRIRHENEGFIGFTSAAIRDGQDNQQVVATAEVMVWNCRFEDCERGIALTSYNDYDWLIEGCLFQECNYGVTAPRGKCWVHHTRFEDSGTVDIYLGVTGGDSIRRCISVGSYRFIETGYGSGPNPTIVENCVIDDWTATDGAIKGRDRGPLCVTDSIFSNPPSDDPPIVLNQWSGVSQRLIVSNNSTTTTNLYDLGGNGDVVSIPTNGRTRLLTSSNHSYFSSEPYRDPDVLDAELDFCAAGDNTTDDTTAIQNLIDAARTAGNGTIAYIPPGTYRITSTLDVTGSDYVIQGSGFRTDLRWHGATDGTMMEVDGVRGVRLDAFCLAPDVTTTADFRHIVQTDNGGYASSDIVYDGVYLKGTNWSLTNGERGGGLEFFELGSGCTVRMLHFDGRIIANASSEAQIYGAYTVDGRLDVKGTSDKTGRFGLKVRVNSGNTVDITVDDNQDLVISDWYCEQTGQHLAANRGSGTGTGHITMQGQKLGSTSTSTLVTVDNYAGRIVLGPHNVREWITGPVVQHQGSNALDFGFMGCYFDEYEPTFSPTGSGWNKIMAQNIRNTDTERLDVTNVLPTGSLDVLAAALADIAGVGSQAVSEQFYDGAAAFWDFNGDTIDHVGGHDASAVGPTLTTGCVDQGYVFDGTDDYMTTGWSPTLKAMTVAAWIYPNSDGDHHTIIGDGIVLDRLFRVTSGGAIELCLNGYTNGETAIRNAGNGQVLADQWTHVAVSWDADDGFVAYVNGEVAGVATTNVSSVSWTNIAIGVRRPAYPIDPAEAVLDNVGIWPRALSPTEVADLAQGDRGAAAIWKFDGDAKDYVGGHDATVNGPVLTSNGDSQCYAFDGTDDHMTTGWSPDFPAGLTFAAWVYPTTARDNTIIGDSSSLNHQFRVRSSGCIELAIGGWTDGETAIRNAGSGSVALNTWTHVAITWDPTAGFAAYVNGQLVKSTSTTLTAGDWYADLVIGVRRPPYPIDFFDGALDDIQVYPRALSATEIAILAE